MKKLHLIVSLFMLAAAFSAALFMGCGLLNTSSTSVATPGLFYNNTSSAMPEFEPASASASGIKAMVETNTWESGTILYSVYYSLREYVASRDEGVVDRSNLYKLLLDVDTVYSGLSGEAQTITEQTITPPFSQLSSVVCNKAYNDTSNQRAIALKDSSAETQAIQTWIWTDAANKAEYGIASLNYNRLTNDITVEMTYSVDYDTSDTDTTYNMRCQVAGNTEEHSFQFKYRIGTANIVAKGISEGDGNYMLFKYARSTDEAKYLVVPAGTSESFFINVNNWPINIITDPASLPATVADYKDWVTAEAFFTADDLVTDVSTLNSGNAKEGTIYLNYN